MRIFNFKFILAATFTFIPFTALWFLWHNNIFPHVYYASPEINSVITQNIWSMNFANALLVYGFVYFYWRMAKAELRIIQPVMWGIYYNLSVIGFFSFMMLGITKFWNITYIIYDILWCIAGGAFMGAMTYYTHKRLTK
ncbi:MAG TPA: hypothetical protein PKE39_09220 [Ignavibacteria bacterium]|nr:hypothetical protein [Ignavibacteria bacterium]HMQ99191.1 hypothetical protein [Ignavibacteria bacterium]